MTRTSRRWSPFRAPRGLAPWAALLGPLLLASCSDQAANTGTNGSGGERLPGTVDAGADVSALVAQDAVSCTGWTSLQRLSPEQVQDLLTTIDPFVINVHVPFEGDIPQTDVEIPYYDVNAIEAFVGHDHCADILLVCKSGGMSQSAGNELVTRGYLRVRDLAGGMQAWQAAGHPLR